MANIGISLLLVLLYISCISGTVEPASGKENYIKALCKNVPYPVLCIQYLSLFPNSTLTHPVKMAKAALMASLYKTHHTRLYILNVANQLRTKNDDHKLPAFARECLFYLRDAVYQLKESIMEFRYLRCRENDKHCDISSHVENINIWTSAAISDTESCLDMFPSSSKNIMGKLKAAIKSKALNVYQAASNALNLFCNHAANFNGK